MENLDICNIPFGQAPLYLLLLADSSGQLINFYFLNNYGEPLFELGIQHKDRLVLAYDE